MTIVDLINAVKLPFILMLILSILLIHTIIKSRLTVIRMTNNNANKNKLKKSIQFAVSSICCNFIFLILNLPYTISFLSSINIESDIEDYLDCLYLFSFCVNFYILFCFNSVYRKEVLILIGLRKSQYAVDLGSRGFTVRN